jgi:hypothetical protein
MNFAALFFWLLIAWSVTASRGTLLVLLFASMPFAGLALLPPASLGMSILPQAMFAVVLILKVVTPQLMPLSPKLLTALQLRRLGCLALFLLVGTVITIIAPRLLLGEVMIVPMRESWLRGDLLRPVMANITQSGYVALSVLIAFAVTLMVDDLRFVKTLLTGLLAGGVVCVATGLIDMVAASTGMESLLAPFRNADYADLSMAGVADQRRVVGFTPEASSYGTICVEFAAAILLLQSLFAEGRQRVLAASIGIGLVVMALLSTSSTAYFGLAVFGLIYLANWVRRAAFSSPLGRRGLLWELFIGLGAIAAVLFVLIARADLFDPLLKVIDEIIFNKPLSDSFYERSFWNKTAWETVASTWGLGIGFGSTRTSNWFAAIISNAGLIGAAFMALFLLQTFASRPIWRTALSTELLAGLKLSLLLALAMVGTNAAGPDFGLWMGVGFGAIVGVAALHPGRSSIGHVAVRGPKPPRVGGHRAIWSPVIGRSAPLTRRPDSEPDKAAPRPSF